MLYIQSRLTNAQFNFFLSFICLIFVRFWQNNVNNKMRRGITMVENITPPSLPVQNKNNKHFFL
jgi:hypothetical protein